MVLSFLSSTLNLTRPALSFKSFIFGAIFAFLAARKCPRGARLGSRMHLHYKEWEKQNFKCHAMFGSVLNMGYIYFFYWLKADFHGLPPSQPAVWFIINHCLGIIKCKKQRRKKEQQLTWEMKILVFVDYAHRCFSPFF